jgi:hypothetical protein
MAGKPDGGLKDALQLDKAADDIVQGRAAAAEKAADEQLALFSADRSVFGTIVTPAGELHRSGPGRPRGSLNRRTRDLAEWATAMGGNPVLRMIEIVATPIDVIARTLQCKLIDAAEYHRKVMSDLAPYLEQKLPTAIQVQGANAGMLVINAGGPVDARTIGLDLRLVAANAAEATRIIDAENLNEINDGDGAPHDSAPHDDAK